MSSHHFVREGQEPALFILEAISFNRVAPLLEWVPLVIVAEQALEQVLNWGIKMDVVIQQNLPVEDLEKRLSHQFPLEVIAGQNVLVIVMEHLIRAGHKSVNIISDSPLTFIHELEKFGTDLQIVIYSDMDKWSYVAAGRFEKWLPAKHCFYVLDDNSVSVGGTPTTAQGNWRETVQSGLIVIESPLPFWIVERFSEPEISQ